MEDGDLRQLGRDSLFLHGDLRIDGIQLEQKVRVRNLSAGGLMAEGADLIQQGMTVWVNLRNLGWIEGIVAWVQGNRCGVAFLDEIDPRLARSPITIGESTPRFVRPPLAQLELAELRKL